MNSPPARLDVVAACLKRDWRRRAEKKFKKQPGKTPLNQRKGMARPGRNPNIQHSTANAQ